MRYFFLLCIALPTAQASFLHAAQRVTAQYETANFSICGAPTARLAKEFCETAERCRADLAMKWLGKAMPDWSEKCPITVTVGEKLGAGGATSFVFQNGEVFGWEMDIQGSAQRILDSVLPHEITHMVLASHFRRPVPRWLDEGAATSVEHASEKENYRNMLHHFLRDDVRKCLPFRHMVALREYPADPMPFYAQGFSVVEYLLALGDALGGDGPRRLVRFALDVRPDGQHGDWDRALREHYKIENLGRLQQDRWIAWVETGSPKGPAFPVLPRKSTADADSRFAVVNDSFLAGPPPASQPPSQIALVSARPSPPYGQSVYENLARAETPIPTKMENGSETMPIPILIDAQRQGIYR